MEPKYRYKLAPCPVYDLAGMQEWLEEMAAKGLHLDPSSGFFLGMGIFTQGQPAKVRYRMEAVRYRKLFSKYKGDPNDAVAELAEEFGWQLVCRHREFDIYRTEDSFAPEFNTDPDLQAASLRSVESKLRSALFSTIFWVILWPFLAYRRGAMHLAVELGAWISLGIIALLAGELGVAVYRLIWFSRLRRRMRTGEGLPRAVHGKGYSIAKWSHRVLAIGFVLALLVVGLKADSPENKLPLDSYSGQPPFATARDVLAELGVEGYVPDTLMAQVDESANTFVRTAHWPAVETIHWEEHLRATGQEPDYLWLDVSYYQLRWEWAARLLFEELHFHDKTERRMVPLDLTLPQLDQGEAYEYYHSRVLLLRQGETVIRVQCYGYGDEETLGRIFAEKMAE